MRDWSLAGSLAALASASTGVGMIVAGATGAAPVPVLSGVGAGLLTAGVLGIAADALGAGAAARRRP